MEVRTTSPASADKAHYHMVDVGEKKTSYRRAKARGAIYVGKTAFTLIVEKKIPKGDVLAIAEIAGIGAAKKTSDTLPLCHPIGLEKVQIHCQLNPTSYEVEVTCEVATHSKTGVEMEALNGTSSALLCIYDLVKMVQPSLKISEIRLDFKEGGKQGLWAHPEASPVEPASVSSSNTLQNTTVGIITVSDRVSKGLKEDRSGPAMKAAFEKLGAHIGQHCVVPDDVERIARTIQQCTAQNNLICLSGGTGLGPRDVTPLALRKISQRIIPGIGELLRSEGAKFTPFAWLSHSEACIVDKSLVIALPGSPRAVIQGIDTLSAILPHALHIVSGGDH